MEAATELHGADAASSYSDIESDDCELYESRESDEREQIDTMIRSIEMIETEETCSMCCERVATHRFPCHRDHTSCAECIRSMWMVSCSKARRCIWCSAEVDPDDCERLPCLHEDERHQHSDPQQIDAMMDSMETIDSGEDERRPPRDLQQIESMMSRMEKIDTAETCDMCSARVATHCFPCHRDHTSCAECIRTTWETTSSHAFRCIWCSADAYPALCDAQQVPSECCVDVACGGQHVAVMRDEAAADAAAAEADKEAAEFGDDGVEEQSDWDVPEWRALTEQLDDSDCDGTVSATLIPVHPGNTCLPDYSELARVSTPVMHTLRLPEHTSRRRCERCQWCVIHPRSRSPRMHRSSASVSRRPHPRQHTHAPTAVNRGSSEVHGEPEEDRVRKKGSC